MREYFLGGWWKKAKKRKIRKSFPFSPGGEKVQWNFDGRTSKSLQNSKFYPWWSPVRKLHRKQNPCVAAVRSMRHFEVLLYCYAEWIAAKLSPCGCGDGERRRRRMDIWRNGKEEEEEGDAKVFGKKKRDEISVLFLSLFFFLLPEAFANFVGMVMDWSAPSIFFWRGGGREKDGFILRKPQAVFLLPLFFYPPPKKV